MFEHSIDTTVTHFTRITFSNVYAFFCVDSLSSHPPMCLQEADPVGTMQQFLMQGPITEHTRMLKLLKCLNQEVCYARGKGKVCVYMWAFARALATQVSESRGMSCARERESLSFYL